MNKRSFYFLIFNTYIIINSILIILNLNLFQYIENGIYWYTLLTAVINMVITTAIIPEVKQKIESISLHTILKARKLKCSKNWNNKRFKKLGLGNIKDLKRFLIEEDWPDLFKKIQNFKDSNEWLKKSFESIRYGSKGLAESMYLDYALINVPPPPSMFEELFSSLHTHKVVGFSAPTGWGKSRTMLWLSLAFHLEKYDVYYFPDPLGINVNVQDAIKEIIAKNKKIFIFDDFHLCPQNPNFMKFKREIISEIKEKDENYLIFIQTKQENEKEISWPANVFVCLKNYIDYWEEGWKKQFFKWFQCLKNTPLNEFFIPFDESEDPSIINPWGFVSIMVDLREQIENQLIQESTMHKFILITLITWGYCINNETGLSLDQIYSGLLWVKNNKPSYWSELVKSGGRVWDHIYNEDKSNFIDECINIIKEWQRPPSNYHTIRLLPLPRKTLGGSILIIPFHKLWWFNAIKDLWDQNLSLSPWIKAKEACEYAILNCSFKINSQYLSDLNILFDSLEGLHELQELTIRFHSDLDYILNTIGNLFELKKLILTSNDIKEIPESIWNLPSLEELYLNDNSLTAIPETIGNLENLKILDLSSNMISHLPPSISNLKSLKSLDLSANNLKSVPRSIGSLTNLKILKMILCNLDELPDFIGNLSSLETLEVENNNLENLPDSIGNLSFLRTMTLYKNRIKCLPDSIGSLKSLKTLWMGWNDLKKLPNTFAHLDSLVEVDIGANEIRSLPRNFTNLKSLEDLIVCVEILDTPSCKIIEELKEKGVKIEYGIAKSKGLRLRIKLKGQDEFIDI